MTEITRLDLLDLLGKKGHSLFNTLRDNGLGSDKQVRIIRDEKSIRHRDVIRNLKHFNVDECISFFKARIEKEKSNPFARFSSRHIKNWNGIIEKLEHFKGL